MPTELASRRIFGRDRTRETLNVRRRHFIEARRTRASARGRTTTSLLSRPRSRRRSLPGRGARRRSSNGHVRSAGIPVAFQRLLCRDRACSTWIMADAVAGLDEGLWRRGWIALILLRNAVADHDRRRRLAPAPLRSESPGHEVQVQRRLARQGQQELSVPRPGSRQRLLDIRERRPGVDGVRGHDAMGASERIFPRGRLGGPPGLLFGATALHTGMAGGAFLRDPSPDPLDAAL